MARKVGLIILDGLGISQREYGNAFFQAKKPTIEKLLNEYPHCMLEASGLAVGLPEGQPGNSEIGHLNIGAGRLIKSELVRINDDVANGTFYNNPNLQKAIALAKSKNVKFHIMGLTSTGGTHSQLDHIIKVLEECNRHKVQTVLHCFTDGRDGDINDFQKDVKTILNTMSKRTNVSIGSVGGRYYAMDRDNHWERINTAINSFLGYGLSFSNIESYIANSYGRGITDEFIIPAYNSNRPDSRLSQGDVVFIANFRQDRVRQLAHMIKKSDLYDQWSQLWDLNLTLVTMTQYDGIKSDIVVYPPQVFKNTLGEVIAKNNLKQLRIAETEKYAHVTFFFDGGTEQEYNGETKILIKSPNVATYDLKPEMSAKEITEKLISNIANNDVIICNFANCDMVGHTGRLGPTQKAVETVDNCLKEILAKAQEQNMTLFITSDHGNCDCMISDNQRPNTGHTCSPVFFISTDKSLKLKDGCLANIAPTILKYLEIDIPKEMNKDPLY